MKKILCMLAISASLTMSAQMPGLTDTADSLRIANEKITALDSRLGATAKTVEKLGDDVKANTDSLKVTASAVSAIDKKVDEVTATLDNAIAQINEKIGTEIAGTRSDIASVETRTGSLMTYIIIALVVVILIFAAAYFILRKRIGDGSLDLDSVKEANRKLQEQSVELDSRLAQLLEQQLKMSDSLKNVASTAAETDHSLILSIANEMMRIEQNLAFMDPKTKGVSQLRNRAAAIAASLKSKGYEIPSLVGTEYRDGMNMEATMEEDDTIDSAKMIIKRVTRPAVLYNGKMIQAASVVVAFNPDFTE